MLKIIFVVTTLLIPLLGTVNAQERKHPSNFMNAQLSEQLLNQTTALSNDELVKAQAKLLRKHYLALIESGFTKSEALQIVVAMASRDK
ncbi:hypothetical protein [Paraglaciecola sp. 2405UD69-4]|uniref:hypothetical protein n=1 Tax=Paraglaciecola sp. 2405UD69-4 TaxID=3391836 RepID=UPI0039C8D597